MDDVELRRFINNLINYTENKPIDLPTRIDQMVWNDVVEVLDHNETKRQVVAEKRRIAGQKGGAPVGNNNAQKKTDVVDETNKNNQMVEEQPKQTKQPEESKELSDGCKELSDGCNMLNEKGQRLVGIMKQVIEDGYIDEDIVINWKITDTREILNKMLYDYQYWENDFNNLGLDGFLRKVPLKSNIQVDYILHSTLKAHEIL